MIGAERLAGWVLLAAACCWLEPRPAGAQAYPDRTIKIIVPVAPGGSADLVARNIGARLTESLGKPVVVESRAGAGGEIGVEAVVRSSPDGYTLLSSPNGPISVAGHLQNLHFDVANDLVPVAMEVFVGAGIGVNAALPIYSIADLIKASKDNPQGLNFSHSGVGNHMHLSGELLKQTTGANFVPVAYRGTSPAVTAILTGETQFGIADMTSLMPLAEAGKIRILAVVNSTRISAAPNVPTVAEAGIAGFGADAWIGLFAPGGTPTAIVERINAEVGRALARPETRNIFLKAGLEPVHMPTDRVREFVRDDITKWGRVVKELNLKAQ
jgi:tripartite-type tricarboxylate transporter receptor subunit TctC